MADKVIVTNITALKDKYGATGLSKIHTAIKRLIAADKKREISTVLVALDNKKEMSAVQGTAVDDPLDPRQNKNAIDAVFNALTPDYLMILGAIDVVPHQDLKNPLFTEDENDEEGDNEESAFGDLPYACDARYSRNIKNFTGPTRVVGRLPDLTGAKGSPKYLLGLLETAATWKSRPVSAYRDYLGITADAWTESTQESLTNIFSNDTDLQTSPTKGFKWTKKLINRRMHFINCHGGDTLSEFFGEAADDEDDMPVSHQAAFVGGTGRVAEGTVAAAECCFGAQLYDPTAEENGQMGMCNVYLQQKGYGFFGSSTTAYGPVTGNDEADLICQYFIQRVLRGSSLGRATLEARQRFIQKASPLSPTNRKTLAQFSLLGDPSIHPVAKPKSKKVADHNFRVLTTGGASLGAKSLRTSKIALDAEAAERAERRDMLTTTGKGLTRLQPTYTKSKGRLPKKVQTSLAKYMKQMHCVPRESLSFCVDSPSAASAAKKSAAKKSKKKSGSPSKSVGATPNRGTTGFHVMFGVPESRRRADGFRAGAASKSVKKRSVTKGLMPGSGRLRKFIVLEAKEVDGKIVAVTEAHSK